MEDLKEIIMNDLLGTILDLINNRVKDNMGNVVEYGDEDRKIYIKVFNDIKNGLSFNKDRIDSPSYELLISIADKALEIIENNKI